MLNTFSIRFRTGVTPRLELSRCWPPHSTRSGPRCSRRSLCSYVRAQPPVARSVMATSFNAAASEGLGYSATMWMLSTQRWMSAPLRLGGSSYRPKDWPTRYRSSHQLRRQGFGQHSTPATRVSTATPTPITHGLGDGCAPALDSAGVSKPPVLRIPAASTSGSPSLLLATMHLAGMFTIHADSSHDPPLAAASNQLIAYIHLCVPTLCGDFTGWM